MQDALFSLGVVVSAAIIYFTGWSWLDPIASIIISIFLLKEIFSILFEAVDMMLDSVPKDINFSDVKGSLAAIAGVIEIDDLHIWQTGSENRFLSAHLIIEENAKASRIKLLASAAELVKEKYNIHHSTIQIVSEEEIKEVNLECEHCN
jgi:cobalt-zinc-cadmium efflux system protein